MVMVQAFVKIVPLHEPPAPEPNHLGKISLTIDNGPDPVVTPEVLDVLAATSVTATFFLIGERVAEPGGAALVARIAGAGHPIGNHSWSHDIQFGTVPTAAAVRDEVARTAALLVPWMAAPPLFRPPGGGGRLDERLLSEALIGHLCAEGYTCALWNVVPRDWEDPDGWVERALGEVARRDWSVVVVHDTIPGNAARIAAFIEQARAAGHEFVAELAPDCLPIVAGSMVHDLSPLTTASA